MSNTSFTPNTPPDQRAESAENVSRADALLFKIAKQERLTPEGLEWLKTALDPFPDETRKSPGFPDMISSKSIRYPVKIETQITDGGLGAPWDCNIAFQGLFADNRVRQTGVAFNCFAGTGQGATDFQLAGFQVRRALAGTALPVSTIVTSLLPVIPANPFRVVSLGMEVQNQTEPLYRSGGCVSYRMPDRKSVV